MVFLLCQAVLDVGESGVDRTGFSPLCRNSFNIGVFFSDIMKQYVSYSFYVYFNKGQKTGMEGGEGWGMLMKSIHFLSTRFICLNKNSILVWLFFFLGLWRKGCIFTFIFSFIVLITSRGCIEGQLLNFYGIHMCLGMGGMAFEEKVSS